MRRALLLPSESLLNSRFVRDRRIIAAALQDLGRVEELMGKIPLAECF
jgi:hypothetical protein